MTMADIAMGISRPPCGTCGHAFMFHYFHYAEGGGEGCAMHMTSDVGLREIVECPCARYEPKSYDEEPGPTSGPTLPEIDHPFGQEIVLAQKPNEWPIRTVELDPEKGLDSVTLRHVLKDHRAWLVRIEVVAELELVEPEPYIQPKSPF